MSRHVLVLVALWSCAAASVEAQRIVAPGDTIRLVRVDTRRWERGVVQQVADGSLQLRSAMGEAYSVPAQQVRKLHILAGRRSGATRGLQAGGALGLMAGVAAGVALAGDGFISIDPEQIPVVAITLGLSGALVGGMLGALTRESAWVRGRVPGDGSPGPAHAQSRVDPIIRPGAASTVLLGTRIRW